MKQRFRVIIAAAFLIVVSLFFGSGTIMKLVDAKSAARHIGMGEWI